MAKGGKRNRQNAKRTPAPRRNPNINPSNYTLNAWLTMKSKPEIKKGQNVYTWAKNITVAELPGLATYMSTYQSFILVSLGARFISAYTHVPGLVGLLVTTEEKAEHLTYPQPVNHQFLVNNGCTVRQLIRQTDSPASTNEVSVRRLETTSDTAKLGNVIWTWEGPQFAEDQTHCGEIKILVNIQFFGKKA